MLTGGLQERPLNVMALPAESTARQNDDEGHETASTELLSMPTRLLQELPSNVITWLDKSLLWSTTTQNDADEQDSDSPAEPPCAMWTGAPQEVPLKVSAYSSTTPPGAFQPTARQKDAVGQETLVRRSEERRVGK